MLVTILVSMGVAAPAWAHGGGGTDATNFLSEPTGMARSDDGEPGEEVSRPELKWRVIAGDALLELTNEGSETVEILGYSGEPYLRIGPSGVERNENSPATYLNEERYGADVPPEVTEDSEPGWVQISDEPSYYWHDHRIHWMSATLPPAVDEDPNSEHLIFDWSVPFTMGDEPLVLTGRLHWIPPVEVWPWLLGSLGAMTLPLLGAFAMSGEARRRYLMSAGGAVVLIVAVLSGVHSIDDLLAVPATLLENIFASLKTFPFVIGGIVGAVWAWRGKRYPELGLAAGALSVSLGIGISHVFALSNSQIATVLPEVFSRIVFASSMMLIVPIGLAAWWSWRDSPIREAELRALAAEQQG